MNQEWLYQRVRELEAEVLGMRSQIVAMTKRESEVPDGFNAQKLIDDFPNCSTIALLYRAYQKGKRDGFNMP